ncbi:MAG: diacylglycerol kinase family lipid kinase [Chloroflexota bacterium]|nr:diacylglycerol kinase family lipid kinase [Chloroflexota bacterium]
MTGATKIADERALAIVNPVAGNGDGERIAYRIAADFRSQGMRVDVILTPAPDEAARLAREGAADGYQVIIAVGGDGTANEIANGIAGSGAALALYPIGSGNDFARALGYPRRRKDIPRFIRAARRRAIDVGEINGRIFVNSAGVGIDGHVAQRIAATSRVTGKTLGYFAGSLVGIATYRPQPMRVLVDGELHSGRFLAVVAANGTHFGAGMHVAPESSLDDGQLDVLLAGDLSRWSSVVALGKLYRGTHVDGKKIVMKRARVLEIELERPLTAQLDGETTVAQHFSIRVRPGALEVLTR